VSDAPDLLTRAERSPDAPALETPGGTWSFASLADRAARAAAFLETQVRSPEPVGLLLAGGADFVAWFEAAGIAGKVALPLNDRLTSGELVRQLEDARVSVLLGAPGDARLAEIATRIPGLRAIPAPDFDALPRSGGASRLSSARGDALRAVLFTSGTSGRAKGACLGWDNFRASAVAAEDRLGDVVGERWLACMPLFHVGGLSILVRSVMFGGPVRWLPRFDVAAVSEALDVGDVAGISLVPTMLARLLGHRGRRPAPAGLRVVLLGGAAAPVNLLARALEAGYPVCPTYGLTEATSQVATAAPPSPGARGPSPMRPLTGTALRIVDGKRTLPAGTPGEILVRGPTVMHGYLNAAAATRQALRDGWLHTGDIGLLKADGALEVLDRRDDLVVSGGENVYPAEVESVLVGHPAIADAGVAGLPDDDLGAKVVAWVVLAPGARADADAWRRYCRTELAGYKVPREFRCVDALPRNSAGKLLRRSLATIA
jgi:O-succinylbenzoic acid--CoA ligase